MSLCYHKPPGVEQRTTAHKLVVCRASQVHFGVSAKELRTYSSGAIWGGKVSLCGLSEHALSAGKEKEGRKQFFSPCLHTKKPSLSCY